MAEITIQDVAQYLAEHGYATWSELTTRKMLTEDGMWTRLQSNYDSSRAIDPRYITFPTVDLSKYAKEADIKQWVKEQGYATTVPSLSGYATQSWVQEQGFLTQHQSLSDYATQQWVTARIQSSVSGFASQAWVGQTFLQLSGGTLTGDIESQNIIPVTDNEYSLGTSAKRWSIIRTMKADFAGDIYTHGKIYAYGNIQPMPNSNNAYPQLGTSAARWANVVTSGVNCAGNIIPATTETYQLGTSQYRWNNVVTKSINATGSLTIGDCTISWKPSVGMLRFSTGIYSDGAVTAGGVGTSGGGGGGGLTWANLDAATTEQIALSHLTTALAGYVELTGAQTISGVKTFSSQLTVSGRYCIGGWQQEDSYIRANDISVQGFYSLTFGLSDGSRQIYIEDGENIAVTGNVDVSGNIDTDGAMSVNGNVTAIGFIHNSYNSSDYLLTGNGEAISKSTLLNGYATTSQLHSHSNKSVLDGITSTKVSNWDTAYGWGNHASAGYVTGYGNRPSIGMAGSSTTWISENYGVILPLKNAGAGNYQLDLGNRPQIGNLSDNGVAWLSASAYVVMPLVHNAGAGYYQLDLSGYTFMTKESRFYGSESAFLNAYPNVTDEYEVVKYAAVLAKSGNYRLLAITMADTEGNSFNIYETSSSGQTLLWRSNTTRANEQTTALVWMDPNKSYSITL